MGKRDLEEEIGIDPIIEALGDISDNPPIINGSFPECPKTPIQPNVRRPYLGQYVQEIL